MDRKLLILPDCWLRQKSEPVKVVDSHIRELAQFMLDQLEPLEVVGLAAPQFSEMVQLFVIRLHGQEIVMLNPEIVKQARTCAMVEECKSLPGKHYLVNRPKLVKVKGMTLDGEVKVIKGHDLLARALCHEIDHLQGVMIDKIGRLIDG